MGIVIIQPTSYARAFIEVAAAAVFLANEVHLICHCMEHI